MHKNAEELFNKYALDLFQQGMEVFEIGPERQVYTKRNLDNKLGVNNYKYFFTAIKDLI